MDRLLTWLNKIPAGLMLVPLFLGILIHSFCPAVLEIGSFTTAVFGSGAAASFMGLQLLCLGSRLQVKTLARAFADGGILFCARVLGGVLTVALFRFLFGTDMVWGVCVLAAVTAITNTNCSIYLTLCNLLDRPAAVAATPILALNNGPMLPLLLLGAAGYVAVDPISILAMVLPLLLGMFLGNFSKKCSQFLDGGVNLLLPFIGFSMGANIDIKQALSAGLVGVVLAVVVLVIGSVFLICADKFLCKGNGAVGIAAGATGANAVAVPGAMALVDGAWEPFVATATAQIATCAVVSAIVVPLFTVWWQKRHGNVKQNTAPSEIK